MSILFPSGEIVIFSTPFSMLNTGHTHICRGLQPSIEYNYCQHISSVGLAHYISSFMKCDTVNGEKKVFLHELWVQLEQWDMTDLSWKATNTWWLWVWTADMSYWRLPCTSAVPQAPAFVEFFNTLKLSIESVAWTSSFFVTLGL